MNQPEHTVIEPKKPRITWVRFWQEWHCTDGYYNGMGRTPALAYRAWAQFVYRKTGMNFL